MEGLGIWGKKTSPRFVALVTRWMVMPFTGVDWTASLSPEYELHKVLDLVGLGYYCIGQLRPLLRCFLPFHSS